MKKIEAIVQPHKVDAVKEALKGAGIDGLTIYEVHGYGRQKGHTETYRGAEYKVDVLPKVKVELVIGEKDVDRVVSVIMEAARTGKIGDGKIFISSIDEAIRIRNGDRGEMAL